MAISNLVTLQKANNLIDQPWFLPVVICILINVFGLSLNLDFFYSWSEFYIPITEQKQQATLSVIAGSLMTLISITFSISILILSTISGQFGPRLLPNFMHAKITQTTLGFFLATFLFCLFCIFFNANDFARGLQTIYAFILTLTCIALLVLFINHVIKSVQVEDILSLVVANTRNAIKSEYHFKDAKLNHDDNLFNQLSCKKTLHAQESGHITAIDYEKLKTLAKDKGFTIQILVKSGYYIFEGNKMFELYMPQEAKMPDFSETDLFSCVHLMHTRILKQDIEYGFEQISEIAVRSLSPGINDPYTARQCVHLIGELFLILDNQEDIEKNHWVSNEGQLLVVFLPLTYTGIVQAALDRFRQASLSDLTVLLAIYDMIIKLHPVIKNKKLMHALLLQGQALREMLLKKTVSTYDRKSLKEREKKLDLIDKIYQTSKQ